MENKNSYTIVGLFFLISVSLLGIFMWWMSGSDGKSVGQKIYYIQTHELPTGVRVDSQVKFIGVGVGSVSKIDFLDDGKIEISMKIRDDIDIKSDSIAEIELQPISGVASINISRGVANSIKDEKHPIIKLEDSMLTKLRNQAQDITSKINVSLERLNSLLSEDNFKHLNSTLENLDEFSKLIGSKENSKNLSELLANLNAISSDVSKANVSDLSKNLNSILLNANKFLLSANAATASFSELAKNTQSKINSGQLNIKEAMTPLLNEASIFINDFSKTLREFRGAMDRLEDNPYDFFFKDPTSKDGR
ncbi:MlaD family protein [Campylobacter suis]|uniref:Mce/MlaD domain-containing protein n=1 Tax=Campylobacter suis TaxID=2790657 RepID=A0ABM8Q233_9BACT|nr:MlaD family protein [Campylobacter suis]CAD7286809.1 hypothetical protein LMG8286_00548 [Campylobacter suis]